MQPKKVIIDTDPGIDDAMAILMAFNSPELEVIGLTTLYGNVPTVLATKNALLLTQLAGRPEVPVAPGAALSLCGDKKTRIADFVHGTCGLGNSQQPPPQGTALSCSAAEFIVQQVRKYPGQVTILALAALTNVALAIQLDNSITDNWCELVVLGGAVFVSGNVNPAAEANFFGDPEAADFVLGSSSNIRVVGLDVTHSTGIQRGTIEGLRGRGKFGTFVANITKFYCDYHQSSYGLDGAFMHDPSALIAVVRPHLFSWLQGEVRVATQGVARGKAMMDAQQKSWNGLNEWQGRPKIGVAMKVDSERLIQEVLDRLSR